MSVGSNSVRAEDEEAIRAALSAYVRATLDQDWDRFVATFDQEPLCMPAGAPALSTHDEIRGFYTQFPALDALSLVPKHFEAAGDLVVEIGRYEFKAGDFADQGKYVHLWRRGGSGDWKLYRNIANSDGSQNA